MRMSVGERIGAGLMWSQARDEAEARELTLSQDEAWSAVVRAGCVEVRCLAGTVWVTREGEAEDHVLEAGEALEALEGVRRIRLAVVGLGAGVARARVTHRS